MHSYFKNLAKEFLYSSNFQCNQNEIARKIYDTLSKSYKAKDNEVKMVTKLCAALNEEKCGAAKLYAAKIHGKRSYVEFYNGSNERKVKELADMVIISLVTSGEKIILEKIALIQNKKEEKEGTVKWKIDQDQLFLLNNMPIFDGVSGLFSKRKNITLPNIYGQLGNYGLLYSNGDMAFANAKIINALQDGATISFDKIRNETARDNIFYHTNMLFHPIYNEISIITRSPIFGTCDIALNLYQFVRNWTQLNVGETVVTGGMCTSNILLGLTECIFKKMKLDNKFNFNILKEEKIRDLEIDFNGAVFVLRYDFA